MTFTALPRHSLEDQDEKDENESGSSRYSFPKDSMEHESLLSNRITEVVQRWQSRWLLAGLCASNFMLLMLAIILGAKLYFVGDFKDPSLGVWSPANDAVEYYDVHFEAALANKTEYMGFPDDDIDRRWSSLYDFGISVISEEEAKKLPHPTIPIPGTTDYLVELDVWHSLHCLNDLRKLLYPERFQMLERLTKGGVIDRNSFAFRHWDHCVDALRQSLMCQSDVAPIPFHVNIPFNRGIFPRLATTHTCRNFTKVQEWAKEHRAPDFEFMISDPVKLQKIIDESGFDHSPEENMDGLYWMFPGNKFFQHWRDHPINHGKDAGLV